MNEILFMIGDTPVRTGAALIGFGAVAPAEFHASLTINVLSSFAQAAESVTRAA